MTRSDKYLRKDTTEKINHAEVDEMEIQGYKENKVKLVLTVIGTVLTLGLLSFLFTWKRKIKLRLICDSCTLSEASRVLLTDSYGQVFEELVFISSFTAKRFFINKEIKYIWDDDDLRFSKLRTFDHGKNCDYFGRGVDLTSEESESQRHLYGTNEILVRLTSVLTLIYEEAFNPFYIFQLYAVILWIVEGYLYYSVIVLSMSITSIGVTVWETRRLNIMPRVNPSNHVTEMRSYHAYDVPEHEKVVPVAELVPGDVILLDGTGDILPCDVVLLEGNCSVNEAILTGESVPIAKISLPMEKEAFDYDLRRLHILLGGTELIQGFGKFDDKLKAIVIRTGFQSLKGELIRSILFPKPVDIHYYRDFLKSVFLFLILGVAGFVYSAYVWIRNGGSVADIILNSLDVLTIVVPPILPAALTAVLAFAQQRLKKNKVFCSNSKYITICGGVDLVCFDKTGTLTEINLEIAGVVPFHEGRQLSSVPDLRQIGEHTNLMVSMATCHSVLQTGGVLRGNAADITMFKASGWDLLPPDMSHCHEFGFRPLSVVRSTPDSEEIVAVPKQFPFESSQQRMSVIIKKRGVKNFELVVKGAPEKIAELCHPLSVPRHYSDLVRFYTQQGHRLLALAGRKLPLDMTLDDLATNVPREYLEADLELFGLVVMQNQVKETTYSAIAELHNADLKTMMITGDNLQTALFVAKDVGMVGEDERVIQVVVEEVEASVLAVKHLNVTFVDPEEDIQLLGKRDPTSFKSVHGGDYCFCIDGPSFDLLLKQDQQLLEKVLVRGRVFARMLPEQKVQLIEALQGIGRQVMMCGDGCNDCGALKAAHAGISLSMAEASVAAPFTSKEEGISCVPYIIKEGRAANQAAFNSFQYGMAVCLTGFAAILIMFSISTEPSDLQYVYMSEAHILVPFLTLGNIGPWPSLVKRRPPSRLMAVFPMVSIFSFMLWQILVLVVGWTYCHSQVWFEPFEYIPNLRPPNPSYDETVMWQLLLMSCIAAAFTISPGPPYSKHIFTNKIFAVWTVLAVCLTTSAFFCRDAQYVHDLNLKQAPYVQFSGVIYLIGIGGILFCYLWERFFMRGLIYEIVMPWLDSIRGQKEAYEVIDAEIRANPTWPPMGRKEEASHQRIELPVTGESDDFSDSSDSPDNEEIYGMARKPSRPTRLDLKQPTPTHSRQGSIRTFIRNARNQVSFKTFGGGKKGAAYDIAGAVYQPDERISEAVSLQEEKEETGTGGITMTTYRRLDISDLPGDDNGVVPCLRRVATEMRKQSMPELQENLEVLTVEGSEDIALVNYRELNSSTPFLHVNGNSA